MNEQTTERRSDRQVLRRLDEMMRRDPEAVATAVRYAALNFALGYDTIEDDLAVKDGRTPADFACGSGALMKDLLGWDDDDIAAELEEHYEALKSSEAEALDP